MGAETVEADIQTNILPSTTAHKTSSLSRAVLEPLRQNIVLAHSGEQASSTCSRPLRSDPADVLRLEWTGSRRRSDQGAREDAPHPDIFLTQSVRRTRGDARLHDSARSTTSRSLSRPKSSPKVAVFVELYRKNEQSAARASSCA